MKELLQAFEQKRPEIIFEWKDTETEAEGWVVINSLRGGAAGGGTRMRLGLDKNEVESLAKTMEVNSPFLDRLSVEPNQELILIHRILEKEVYWTGGLKS
ncbi:hypothetical protein OKW96_11225 [Sphingobacterium sp. KU25419]|nr:hypothetical protein OKW96_11225 [Sphingobacterium sp. KU25419]